MSGTRAGSSSNGSPASIRSRSRPFSSPATGRSPGAGPRPMRSRPPSSSSRRPRWLSARWLSIRIWPRSTPASRRNTSPANMGPTPITDRKRRTVVTNIPKVRLGLVAVSRDCFPIELSRKRSLRVAEECRKAGLTIARMPTVVENEKDALQALEELKAKKVNALVLYLGNFGPETPATILAQKFDGPVMVAAAAEESGRDLIDGRGDAYCGLLNNSYNMGLRKLRPYVPEYPVGIPDEVAAMIAGFVPVARIILGLAKLKIFGFGPRPQDFLACNAPIKPLYDLGVEIMENSELDLYDAFRKAEGDPKVKAVAADMARELGAGNAYPDILNKLAQFEVALLRLSLIYTSDAADE